MQVIVVIIIRSKKVLICLQMTALVNFFLQAIGKWLAVFFSLSVSVRSQEPTERGCEINSILADWSQKTRVFLTAVEIDVK